MKALSDTVPLRKTTVWGGFREAKNIPHRYGATSGELIQYDQARQLFVWADHASEGIDEVLANGLPVGGWSSRNGQDSTGHPVTFVEFISQQEDSVSLLARGRGKLHASTGARMTNPATVVWDLLANIGGNSVSESSLDRFRAESTNLGIEVAGSIEDSLSIQRQARDICESVGAVFSPDIIGFARVYPGGSDGVSRENIDYRFPLSAQAERASIANSVTVSYAYEDGQPTKSIQLDAPDSIAAYGRNESAIDATWVASPRVAYDVAKRFLAAYARPSWQAKASGIKRSVRVGDTITAAHPVLPYTGDAMILSRSHNFSDGTSEITFSGSMGQPPRTQIIRQSEAFTANEFSGVGIQTLGGERVLTLKEQNDQPIANAAVTLDGQTTRYTDTSGRVSFPSVLMPAGEHTLQIVTSDGRTLTTTVLVQ